MGEKEGKKHDKERRREESDTMHDARRDVERQRGDGDVDDEPEELLDGEERMPEDSDGGVGGSDAASGSDADSEDQ